jgi:hypothetical protein
MNIASRVIQIAMVASMSVAVASYVGQQAAARIEAIYVDIARQLEAARAGLRRHRPD